MFCAFTSIYLSHTRHKHSECPIFRSTYVGLLTSCLQYDIIHAALIIAMLWDRARYGLYSSCLELSSFQILQRERERAQHYLSIGLMVGSHPQGSYLLKDRLFRSSFVSSKSYNAALSTIRLEVTLLGRGTKPCCKLHRNRICAGFLPYFSVNGLRSLSSSLPARTRGLYASTTTPRFLHHSERSQSQHGQQKVK